MATTAMDYEAANGDRYEGSYPPRHTPHHDAFDLRRAIIATTLPIVPFNKS